MVSTTKININPAATTTERNANFTSVPEGSSIYNTTTQRLEYTMDGGTSWEELANTNDISGVVTSITGTTNQVLVDASTGDVTLSLPQDIAVTSSPLFDDLSLTGALAQKKTSGVVAQEKSAVYTPAPFAIFASYKAIAYNDNSSPITFFQHFTGTTSTVPGAENGVHVLSLRSNGATIGFITLRGEEVDVDFSQKLSFQQDTLSYIGTTVGANNVSTGNPYLPQNIVRVIADGAISVNDCLRASDSTDYRVVQMTPLFATNTQVIGVALTSAASPGDEILMVIGHYATLQNSAGGAISRGSLVIASTTENGHVEAGTLASGAEIFAVALTPAGPSGTFVARMR